MKPRKSTLYYRVLITPPELEFENSFDAKNVEIITVMNVSRFTVPIWLKKQETLENFEIKLSSSRVAPGLSVTIEVIRKNITFSPETKIEYFTIFIDELNQKYSYPLIVKPFISEISVNPLEWDFGPIDIGSPAIYKTIEVTNVGQLNSVVHVAVEDNEIELSVFPRQKSVQSNSTSTFDVKLVPLTYGNFTFFIWFVTTRQNIGITIKGKVIMPNMCIYHPNTTGIFTLIDFGATYMGLDSMEMIILQNISTENRIALILAECDEKLMNLKLASEIHEEFKMFEFLPDYHTMSPFEGLLLFMKFKPQKKQVKIGWKQNDDEMSDQEEFFIFAQVIRIHCMDIKKLFEYQTSRVRETAIEEELKKQLAVIMTKSHMVKWNVSSSIQTTKNPDLFVKQQELKEQLEEKLIRICLHGIVESAAIKLQPDALNFGTKYPGELSMRVVLITNLSKLLPIYVRYIKMHYLEMIPEEFVLQPKKSIEVALKLQPCLIGKFKFRVKIHLLWWTCKSPANNMKPKLVHLKTYYLPIQYEVLSKRKSKEPVFNQGITPLITNEVGQNISDIRFDTKYSPDSTRPPYAAILDIKDRPLNYQKDEPCHDLIAFPNDMQRSLRPWPKEKKMRTIFTGVLRYSAPINNEYQFTLEEEVLQNNLENSKNSFNSLLLRVQSKDKLNNDMNQEFSFSLNDKTYKIIKMMSLPPLKQLCLLKKRIAKMNTLIPLTPMQLYNISVHPKSLYFGLVVIDSFAETFIEVTNYNIFPIHFGLFSLVSNVVNISGKNNLIVHANETQKFTLTLFGAALGRFDSHVTYLINNCHSFDLIVYGTVMEKVISLPEEYFQFEPIGLKQCFYQRYLNVLLVNALRAEVEFYWYPDENKNFDIRPIQGIVPPESAVFCNVYYTPTHGHGEWTQRELTTDSERSFIINVQAKPQHSRIFFSNTTLDLGLISLNIPNKKVIQLNNPSYHDVTFYIANSDPFDGLTIRPRDGTIRARGTFTLNIYYCIRGVISFKLNVTAFSGTYKNILYISGKVEFPLIKITPDTIRFPRIHPYAYDRIEITVLNKCQTLSYLQFGLEDFTEYFLSRYADPFFKHLKSEEILEMKPNETISLFMHFHPRDVATLAFEVPILVNGFLGKLYLDHSDNMKRGFLTEPLTNLKYTPDVEFHYRQVKLKLPELHIKSCISKTLISFSQTNLYFNTIVNVKSKCEEIEITNECTTKQIISLCLRDIMQNEPHFLIYDNKQLKEPLTQKSYTFTLHPDETITIYVEALNRFPGVFRGRIPVFVKSYVINPIYSYIGLYSICKSCYINAIPTKVVFRPVPIHTQLSTYIRIYSNNLQKPCKLNYKTTFVNYNETKEEIDFNQFLKIEFPFGMTVSKQMKWIMVKATVIGKAQVTFTATLEIESENEEDGLNCLINLTASFEASLITTQAFCTYKNTRFTGEEYSSIDPDHAMMVTSMKMKRREGWVENTKTNNDNFYIDTIPYFPSMDIEDTTCSLQLTRHLQKTLNAAELWLFEQAFYSTYSYKIPDDLIMREPKLEYSGKKPVRPNIFNLISNVSSSVSQEFFFNKVYKNDEQRIKILIDWFEHLKELILELEGQPILSRPEYFLDYEDYLFIEKKSKVPSYRHKFGSLHLRAFDPFLEDDNNKWSDRQDWAILYRLNWSLNTLHEEVLHEYSPETCIDCWKPMSRDAFYRISKYAWLQLVLEIYKVFFLNKLFKDDICQTCFLDAYYKDVNNKIPLHDINRYSHSEIGLLKWLQSCYDENYIAFSKLQQLKSPLEPRNIIDFENSLDDGIVFCILTFTYCPYLAYECFLDIFLHPSNIVQANHNVSKVIDAWNLLKISFTILPSQIICPNPVLMIMLVHHLYDILPSFKPRRKILFSATLNNTSSRKVKIMSASSCVYRVYFIGENAKQFSVQSQQETIELESNQPIIVNINYDARHIANATATLLLSGAYSPGIRGLNLVFDLIGESNDLAVSQEMNIKAPLYSFHNVTLKLKSPFPNACLYDIYFSNTDANTSKEFDQNFNLWQCIRVKKVPRQLYIQDIYFDTLSESRRIKSTLKPGVAHIHISFGIFNAQIKRFWLAFLNQSVGDFIIQIKIEPFLNKRCGIPIKLTLPDKFPNLQCRCECSSECPLLMYIEIPCRNPFLWEQLYSMFKMTLESHDYCFWDKYFESSIGVKLLSWLTIKESDDTRKQYMSLFKKTVNYSIEGNVKDLFEISSTFQIPDVYSHESIKLPIHLKNQAKIHKNYKLKLISESRAEIRYCKIKVIQE